ncbi:MAG: hypothetical protein ISQ52_06675 [Synechococcus sp. BS307-5m-G38]|nr:hypothetical protein [Synechococcus sp. BS307-5m-G38]
MAQPRRRSRHCVYSRDATIKNACLQLISNARPAMDRTWTAPNTSEFDDVTPKSHHNDPNEAFMALTSEASQKSIDDAYSMF